MSLDVGRMQRFTAALLTEAGALVESVEPDGLEVLADPPLQQALLVGELSRFGFGPTLPEGAQRIGIESDWLARFERLVGERGRYGRDVLCPAARKMPEPERLLEQELNLGNASFRLLGSAPAWTRYLVVTFRFTALSDEKREGLVSLPFNLATGAMAHDAARAVHPITSGDLRMWALSSPETLTDLQAIPLIVAALLAPGASVSLVARQST